MCGWILARSHARSGDPVAMTEYLGTDDEFDTSITDFSRRYADHNKIDYKAFVDAVRADPRRRRNLTTHATVARAVHSRAVSPGSPLIPSTTDHGPCQLRPVPGQRPGRSDPGVLSRSDRRCSMQQDALVGTVAGQRLPPTVGPQSGLGPPDPGETVAGRPSRTTLVPGGTAQRCCTPPAQPLKRGQDLSGDRSLTDLMVPGVEGNLTRCRDPSGRRHRSQMAALSARPANLSRRGVSSGRGTDQDAAPPTVGTNPIGIARG
jgi:hypothetical protein